MNINSKSKNEKILLFSILFGIFLGSIVNLIISWIIYSNNVSDDKVETHKKNLIIAACILFLGSFTLQSHTLLFGIFISISLLIFALTLTKNNSHIQAISWTSISGLIFLIIAFLEKFYKYL